VTFIHATVPKTAAATSSSESAMFRPQSKKSAKKVARACHVIGRFLSADKIRPRKIGRCRPIFCRSCDIGFIVHAWIAVLNASVNQSIPTPVRYCHRIKESARSDTMLCMLQRLQFVEGSATIELQVSDFSNPSNRLFNGQCCRPSYACNLTCDVMYIVCFNST